MLSNRRAEAAAAHLHIRRKWWKHSASPAGRPCLTQINSPEQGQCTGKNSGAGSCLPYCIPITNGRWKTWHPQTLAPSRWFEEEENTSPSVCPLLGNVVPSQKPSSKAASPQSADLLSASVTSAGLHDVNQLLLLLTWKTQRGGSWESELDAAPPASFFRDTYCSPGTCSCVEPLKVWGLYRCLREYERTWRELGEGKNPIAYQGPKNPFQTWVHVENGFSSCTQHPVLNEHKISQVLFALL